MSKKHFNFILAGSVAALMVGYGPKPVLAPEDGSAGAAEEAKDSSAASSDDKTSTDTSTDNTNPGDALFDNGDAKPDADDADKGGDDDDKGKDGDGDKEEASDVPENYELQMPDGVELDKEALERFSPVFKELGLSNEQAQKLADLRAQEVQTQVDKFEEVKKGWRDQIAKDPELGGTKLQESQNKARAAFNQLGSPELAGVLVNSGLSDHPEVRRLFVKLHDLVGDDELPGSSGGKDTSLDAALGSMYPTMK